MTDSYITTSEHDHTPGVPDERYEIFSPTIIDDDDFADDNEVGYFPLFDSQNDIFKELPDYVWENQRARRFLLQLALVYEKKRNPSYSYTPIRAVKEADFMVLEWLFQDKRFTFYFSEVEDDKYSILFFNAKEKTFVNAVKKIDPEHCKEIAEEVLSFIS